MKKQHLLFLFGGKSPEHEISIRSAQSVYTALDKKKYSIQLCYIDKTGRFRKVTKKQFTDIGKKVPSKTSVKSLPLYDLTSQAHAKKIDVVLPILHGPMGEDGTLQGWLTLLDLPYVGPDVLGSAVGMDKDVQKRLLHEAGIPIAPFVTVRKQDPKPQYTILSKTLGMTMFVKPANAGSSVGVHKVKNEKEFRSAVNNAFLFDTKILIEQTLVGREMEISALGNETVELSVVGEIIPSDEHGFYSYDSKYIDEKGAQVLVDAPVTKSEYAAIKEIAEKTYRTLCMEGLNRIDFFLSKNGDVFINEVNTIPGFTSISMYPKLWEASGLSFTKLLDKLIALGIARHKRNNTLKTSFAV